MKENDMLVGKGKIKSIEVRPRPGKDSLVKFKLENHPQEFSLFGKMGYREGDEVEFDYVIKDGIYYNVKSFRDHKILNKEPITTEELKQIKERVDYSDNRPLAMELAFKYGIIKNYELDEIYTLYDKILDKLK